MDTSDTPLIRTQADLERLWRRLMKPLGFHRPGLWMMLVGPDDSPLRQLVEVDDLPEVLDALDVEAFGSFLARVLNELVPGGRVALLMVRPGSGGASPADRARAAALYDGCRSHGVATEVIHLATDTDILPLPMDEVDARSA